MSPSGHFEVLVFSSLIQLSVVHHSQPLRSCWVQQEMCQRSSCPLTLTPSQCSVRPSRSLSPTLQSSSPPTNYAAHKR